MINEAAIQNVVRQVRESENRLSHLGGKLRQESPKFNAKDILEPNLHYPLDDAPVVGSIAAVDGGVISQELHSIDLLLVRSAAVVFHYNGGLKSYDFIPSRFPPYEIFNPTGLESHEFAWYKNLARLNAEISRALEVVKTKPVSAMLLDGSIVPQPSDKPPHNSPLYAEYEKLIATLKELYQLCEQKNCMLIGVIKDSKGKHFLNLLKRELRLSPAEEGYLHQTNDTTFISSLLKERERTFAFRYTQIVEHPVLKDLGEFRESVATVYVKCVAYDRPMRLEFLLPKAHEANPTAFINRLASLIYTLSKHNKHYAYPPILIEADLHAMMTQKEMDIVYRKLCSALGFKPSILELRRNTRPFR